LLANLFLHTFVAFAARLGGSGGVGAGGYRCGNGITG